MIEGAVAMAAGAISNIMQQIEQDSYRYKRDAILRLLTEGATREEIEREIERIEEDMKKRMAHAAGYNPGPITCVFDDELTKPIFAQPRMEIVETLSDVLKSAPSEMLLDLMGECSLILNKRVDNAAVAEWRCKHCNGDYNYPQNAVDHVMKHHSMEWDKEKRVSAHIQHTPSKK